MSMTLCVCECVQVYTHMHTCVGISVRCFAMLISILTPGHKPEMQWANLSFQIEKYTSMFFKQLLVICGNCFSPSYSMSWFFKLLFEHVLGETCIRIYMLNSKMY